MNLTVPEGGSAARAALEAAVAALWAGAAGWTVRCTPRRWTVMHRLEGGDCLFAKLRRGRPADADREWRWLREFPDMGFRAPEPIARWTRGRRSLLCTRGLEGRPLDAILQEAAATGRLQPLLDHLCHVVAPLVRRLHDRGLAFRDLYWNHLFSRFPEDRGEPSFLDLERVFRPRLRSRRWWIKDLAGLCASVPIAASRTAQLRFLRSYLGGLPPGWKDWATRVSRKAERIRGHRPKYG